MTDLRLHLRLRVLTAAVLPAVLVALALGAILLDRQYRGLDDALLERALANARQLASAAEFGVFTGSRESLAALGRAMKAGDPDFVAVSILDVDGAPFATSGTPTFSVPLLANGEDQVFKSRTAVTVAVPIWRSRLDVDDIYSGGAPGKPTRRIDGFVVLELSRRNLDRERNRQLLIGAGIALAGVILAGWLASRIARGVTRPILHIADVVERIGHGELTARVTPDPGGTVPVLEAGINAMARRIGSAQENLVQQIAAATAELRERKDEAERANSAKTRFLAAASHDLRQPLHALGLFVSRLAQMPHEPALRPLVGQIDASVAALQDLLDSLLDISRLDAGLVMPHLEDFPVAELFTRLAIEHEGLAEEKKLLMRVRPSNLWLHTDSRLLSRILANFIGNALRYTRRGGALLACRRRGDNALIQIWDTGVGIAADQLQEIFAEYVQLGNPERDRAKGLGLGLAICDRLAQLLELPLGVRSRPGRGSVFWIEVPLGVPREDVFPVLAEPPGGRMAGAVVVIEGDPVAAAGIIDLLGGWGCDVVGAASSSLAITRCEAAGIVPDMVIAEYRPPHGEDGLVAGLALRRRFGPIPVLLTSADVKDRLTGDAARRRFVLLAKPVRPGKLRAVVQQMLARRKGAPGGDEVPGNSD